MALRDYYRCKKCDAKVVYGPDRLDEDWEPFLLCRQCMAVDEAERERLVLLLRAWAETHGVPSSTTQTLEREFVLKTETVKALGSGFQEYGGAMDRLMQGRTDAALAKENHHE
jgi:hypothetical protein